MQFSGTLPSGSISWQRLVVIAVRLGVAASLLLLILIAAKLPAEDMVVALDGLAARRTELQSLDSAAQAGLSPSLLARLRALKRTTCNDGLDTPADGARIDELSRRIDSFLAPRPVYGQVVVDGDELRQSLRALLLQLDASAQACTRRKLDGLSAHAQRSRQQVLVLVALLALAVLGLIALRRCDNLARLRQQLHFNEQLLDAIPSALSLRSPQGEFMLINKAFERQHGVLRKDLLGRPVRDTLPRPDAKVVAQMDARALASSEPVEETFHCTGHDTHRDILVRVQALRRDDSTVAGVVGIQTDVTALRRKEAQLTEINAKLSLLSVKMIDAQEDERRRIARDLHDQVGQILTALKLQLSSLARRDRIDTPALALATSIDLAEEALRHTRDLSASLHPHLLDDLGLEPALNWLLDRFIRPSIPRVELRCRLAPARGPADIELVAFRVVQEALTNVVRHAGATRAGVMLDAAGDGELTIEVIDDGVGFDAGDTWFDLQRTTSLGVTSMRDRVTEVGGDLHMDSSPDNGTSLRVTLPWRIQ
jgi:PAS domain S-box-containing protein